MPQNKQPKGSTLRVWGGAIDRTDSFVDLTVESIDYRGNVYFSDGQNNQHSLSTDRIRELHDENLLVFIDEVNPNKNNLWDQLPAVAEARGANKVNPNANEQLKEATKRFFKAAVQNG